MTFAQLTYRDSLADIEVCLRSRHDQLYRLGFRSFVAHSTLADANRQRDWRIYHDLAQGLITRARRLCANESFGVELAQTVDALDSTTIDLCLSLFPWARFRSTKAAVKLHMLLDWRGQIPTMIAISDGKQAEVGVLDELMLEPGAFDVMDRGSVDFARLCQPPSGVFEGMIKIHDLEGVGKAEPAHACQAFSPINEQHDLPCHGQAATQSVLPQDRAELFDP